MRNVNYCYLTRRREAWNTLHYIVNRFHHFNFIALEQKPQGEKKKVETKTIEQEAKKKTAMNKYINRSFDVVLGSGERFGQGFQLSR